MSFDDRQIVDEISQVDRGLRYLLKGSESQPTQALVNFLADFPGPNAGQMFLYESETDALPGDVSAIVMPCLILAPAALQVSPWNTRQSKLIHVLALLGLIPGRTAEPVNRLLMFSLRALFQRMGRIPDTLSIDEGATAHDPETEHLDFVQSMTIQGSIQRTPIAPLKRDQAGEMDDADLAGYKVWGFRVLLAIDLRADMLTGG